MKISLNAEVLENGIQEIYSPFYHFTPKNNWMNDPNGLIYIDGYYHMFFQHDNMENVFSNMSWGHAVSKNLIHWEEQEIAISPDELGMIYSGSTVLDKDNCAGFGEDAIIAFYTSTYPRQQQCIAYSIDKGKSFNKYQFNPVIVNDESNDLPDDFRDPKVIWLAASKKWIMIIGAFNHIDFWTSTDLLHWKKDSAFYGLTHENYGVWECPDLVQLAVEGDEQNYKWVLFVSSTEGGINGGCCTKYYIGDLELNEKGNVYFHWDENPIKWLDYGRDNYASVTWSNVNDRAIMIGWMNNWEYAFQLPTHKWKGMMTLPRELSIQMFSGEMKIVAKPIKEFDLYLHKPLIKARYLRNIHHSYIGKRLMGSKVSVTIDLLESIEVGVELFNDHGERVRIGYNIDDELFYVDRRYSEDLYIHDAFNHVHITEKVGRRNKIEMEIYIDRTSVEVFFESGEYAMTELLFPVDPYTNLNIYGDKSIDVYNVSVLAKD